MTIHDHLCSRNMRRQQWRKPRATEIPLPVAMASAAALALLAATFGLWLNLGTTIFFETIRTGFSLCG
jgi:hypothetical protein